MLPSRVLLVLAGHLLTAASATKTKDFSGLGQLRTLYIGQDHEDLGCLTSAGQWTVDETHCGEFFAADLENYTFNLYSSKTGACGIDVATFKCGEGVKAARFGTWGPGVPAAGREALRYGQYGVFATDAPDSPPALTDAPLPIHFYTGIEKGKWVWLGWKSLEGE